MSAGNGHSEFPDPVILRQFTWGKKSTCDESELQKKTLMSSVGILVYLDKKPQASLYYRETLTTRNILLLSGNFRWREATGKVTTPTRLTVAKIVLDVCVSRIKICRERLNIVVCLSGGFL